LFRIDAAPLELQPSEIMERLGAIGPDILRGAPSSLEALAEEAPDKLGALRLKRVFSGAEQLTERGRRLIEGAAGCKLLDFYGASEVNLIGWQCDRCGLYHTCDDSVIVEVLRDGRPAKPGEDGEIYVTALHGFAMPFLRYEVGDLVSLPRERPPCGIRFGVLENIQGRSIDCLKLPGGRKLSPYLLMNELDELHELRRYEAEQDASGRVVVRFQLEPARSADDVRAAVLERCRRVIPPEIDIDLCVVERFELDPSQKRRFVRSEAPSPEHVR